MKGELVVLRRADPKTDLRALAAGWATPDIAATLDDPAGSLEQLGAEAYAYAYLENAAKREAAGVALALTIVLQLTGEIAGLVSIERSPKVDGFEIGYWTLPEHRNRGYATDAVVGAVRWALANGAECIWAEAYDRRSAAVLEQAGFKPCTPTTPVPAARIGARHYRCTEAREQAVAER